MAGGLRVDGGAIVAADHVVSLADVVARPMPGLPVDRAGFVPVDLYGRVTGEPFVYAAGEATAFPLRQGGIAAQQADAVAAAIAAQYAGGDAPAPFAPVLRGRLTTSGAPLYLQAGPSGQSLASSRAVVAAREGGGPLPRVVPCDGTAAADRGGAARGARAGRRGRGWR